MNKFIKNYQTWINSLADIWSIPIEELNSHNYDYKQYYNDNTEEAWNQLNNIELGIHFPDKYKTKDHPTYPDLGEASWSDDGKVFNISERQLDNSDNILHYLGSDLNYNNGGTKVMYDGTVVLPTVNVIYDTKTGQTHLYNEMKPNIRNSGFVFSDYERYPEKTLEDIYEINPQFANNVSELFKLHSDLKDIMNELSGMALGGGMNQVPGPRFVIANPYSELMQNDIRHQSLLQNERLRHDMDEYNFLLPYITKEQLQKYKGTPYEGDLINIGRTEAARYLSGDDNLLTEELKLYVNKIYQQPNEYIINYINLFK